MNNPTAITFPFIHDTNAVKDGWLRLRQKSADAKQESFFESLCSKTDTKRLIDGMFAYSPYLTHLMLRYPDFLESIVTEGIDASGTQWAELPEYFAEATSEDQLMAQMRQYKTKGALLAGWADLSTHWPLQKITQMLTETAEQTLRASVRYLLTRLQSKGELSFASPEQSGIIVLGMGKLGGGELNYSSDIDLVLLYDSSRLEYHGRHSLQQCLNRFSQDLVRLMQERTTDGYVFRTDLRLRPDPGSTPPIVNIDAAMRYYESVGQNWERAAFIKARPVAGDKKAGELFLQGLKPFLWRKNLDFAAIADIQSLKRQMDSQTPQTLNLAGHNIKTGIGGIREIEFIAQIHQLIWGGKNPALRLRGTCDTLRALVECNLLPQETADTLIARYVFLRQVEHRLQMVDDQQTHAIPKDVEKRRMIASFCGYPALEPFENALRDCLHYVHQIYTDSFDSEPSLADSGNLSFTGVEADSSTMQTLQDMGYLNPQPIIYEIQNWHRGHIRPTRTVRGRQLLTELTPSLLRALSRTVDPDAAFHRFSKFLFGLPAGVQLFSLFLSNPQLLDYIATIMGCAPSLAEHFGRHPELLESILTQELHYRLGHPPNPQEYLQLSRHPDDAIEWLCRFRNEQEFLIGTHLLQGNMNPLEANAQLSLTADATLRSLLKLVQERFAETYGNMPGGTLAVVGLGRLGSEDITFGSDLDLVFLYDLENPEVRSNGDKSLSANVYYNRLFQRLTGALQISTAEGKLYAVDTRLRPGGDSSPIAINLQGFLNYYKTDAWTFEKMALMRHRLIAGDDSLIRRLGDTIPEILQAPLPKDKLTSHVLDMRQRIAKQYGYSDRWNVKYAKGGLIDITFYAQRLALQHGGALPEILQPKIQDILAVACRHDLLTKERYQSLLAAREYQEKLLCVLRLCQQNFNEDTAPEGLKILLCNTLDIPEFSGVGTQLDFHQQCIYDLFVCEIGDYADPT